MAYALFGSGIKLIIIGYSNRANAIRPYKKRYINNFHIPNVEVKRIGNYLEDTGFYSFGNLWGVLKGMQSLYARGVPG